MIREVIYLKNNLYEVLVGAKTVETIPATSSSPETTKESYNADARRLTVVASNVEDAIKKANLTENEVAESVTRHHNIDAV